jgi:ankyrin repeat protein
LRVLHQFGADVNAADNYGATPAHDASRQGYTETLRVLHGLGANLNAADNSGATPAHDASGEGCIETLWVLHDLGANLNGADIYGATPAHCASSRGHYQTLRVLSELGANLNIADIHGVTPVQYASDLGHLMVVELLERWQIAQLAWSRLLFRTLRGKIGDNAAHVACFATSCLLCNLLVNVPQAEHVQLVQHAEPPAVIGEEDASQIVALQDALRVDARWG